MSADKDELNQVRERMHGLNDVVQATLLKHAMIATDVAHLLAGFKEHREDSKAFMSDTTGELREIREQTTKTNGRVTELERRLNAQTGHRHNRKEDPPTDNDPITVKDVKRAALIGGLMVSLLVGIVKGLPLLLKAIQP